MANSRIIITGSNGFIGTRLIKRLSKDLKKRVMCLVVHGSNVKTIKKLGLKYSFCDLLDRTSLKDAVGRGDIILHLAAIIDSRDRKGLMSNVAMVENLIYTAKEKHAKKIIFISSVNAKLRKGLYSLSKYKGEELLKASGIDYCIIRPTVVYDENGKKDIKKIFDIVRRSRIVPVVGSGDYRLQPIYIDNLADLMVFVLKNDTRGVIEVGGPRQFSFNEIVDMAGRSMGKKVYKVKVPAIFVRILSFMIGIFVSIDISAIDKDKIAEKNFMKGTGIALNDLEKDIKRMRSDASKTKTRAA